MNVRWEGASAQGANELFSLRARRALVTGSGQGIGLTLARGLAAAGADIILNDIDAGRLEAAVALLRGENIRVSGLQFDVTKPDEINRALRTLQPAEGDIDILINNAGIHRRAPLESMSLESWQAVIDVNLTSAFFVTRAVIEGMLRRRQGKIINICSLNSEISRPSIANYSAS